MLSVQKTAFQTGRQYVLCTAGSRGAVEGCGHSGKLSQGTAALGTSASEGIIARSREALVPWRNT
jgi:hypothetical protein